MELKVSFPAVSTNSSVFFMNPLHGVESLTVLWGTRAQPVNPLHGVESSSITLPSSVATTANPLHGVERWATRLQ